MRVVNTSEMKEIEEISIEEFGFSEDLIIENVGIESSQIIEEKFLDNESFGEIVVLVGSGNNGADGLAVARHLTNRGHRVRAFLLFPGELKGSAILNQLELAKKFGVRVSEISNIESLEAYLTQLQDRYLVIDAIIGTGFRSPLSQKLFEIIRLVNSYSTRIVALDVPTGISTDGGDMAPSAIQADMTLAIGLPKIGYYISEGARACGEIVVLSAGFPKKAIEGGNMFLLSEDTFDSSYFKRSSFGHKNRFGHSLIIGGSLGLTGAVILASNASISTGTGLVSATTWKEAIYELTSRIRPEIMTGIIPTKDRAVEEIVKALDRFDSIVIGPGLGRGEKPRESVLKVLNHYRGPVIIDADGLRALNINEDKKIIMDRKAPTILTPHIGEFADLFGVTVEEVLRRPISLVRELVDKTKAVVVMKGASTYIGFPDGKVFINHRPNDGLATAGSGDVLAGIIGGMVAQKAAELPDMKSVTSQWKIYESVCQGVLAHSLAGHCAREALGSRFMTAESIIDGLSDAFKELEK